MESRGGSDGAKLADTEMEGVLEGVEDGVPEGPRRAARWPAVAVVVGVEDPGSQDALRGAVDGGRIAMMGDWGKENRSEATNTVTVVGGNQHLVINVLGKSPILVLVRMESSIRG